MSNPKWLLLIYKIPAEPVKNRLAIWRNVKSSGAVYLQNGACVLPYSDAHLRRFKIFENDIGKIGGECVLLESRGSGRNQNERIVAQFNSERNQVYAEFVERCQAFEAEIKRESAAGKFTYAELEEADEDLRKLRDWLSKIRKQDFFNAPSGSAGEKAIQRCETLLEIFSAQVFAAHAETKLISGRPQAPKRGVKPSNLKSKRAPNRTSR